MFELPQHAKYTMRAGLRVIRVTLREPEESCDVGQWRFNNSNFHCQSITSFMACGYVSSLSVIVDKAANRDSEHARKR
jgi:hypothetical protein